MSANVLVVIPAFNEQGSLRATVAELQMLPAGYEVLVVNDGSTDATGPLAEALAAVSRVPMHVIHLACNLRTGGATQTGYRYAARRDDFSHVVQFDADGQHDATSIQRLVRHCREHDLDLCVGSRFLDPAGGGFRSTPARRLGIHLIAGLISLLSGCRVTDPTSGMRCAGPRAWRRFARRYPDEYAEPESLFWCARNRLRIGEIPVTMRPRRAGRSSLHCAQAVFYMVKVLIAIAVDRLRRPEVLACETDC